MWTGIIPNAQLVVSPYPTDTPASWTIDMYIRSSGFEFWVICAVFSGLLATGIAILVFKFREFREDKKGAEKQKQLFHM